MIIDNQSKSSTYYTHGFHPYPAKFTPQVVNKYLSIYCKPGDTVLDPFCGSGTTLVECVLNDINAYGIDLNPIAVIMSKAKTNQYTADQIKIFKEIVSDLEYIKANKLIDYWEKSSGHTFSIPDFPNRNHWFQDNVSKELVILKNYIFSFKDEKVVDLLKCAFSKIIVKVSNQDSEVRYTAKNKNHPDGIVLSSFLSTLKDYIKQIDEVDFKFNDKVNVYHGDTSKILTELDDNLFDYVFTSPPYINTFDYYLYHKQRMFWLDFDHKVVRRNEIGNHHRIDTKSFDDAKSEYVSSMTHIINEISRVSKNGSYFTILIGDGIVEGKLIDMSQVMAEITEKTNYTIKNIESVDLSNITRSFNRKFSNAPKKEHTITLVNNK
ncbi:MAG: hypothetical protein PWQ50_173 [Methanolobus sp.]|jgi:site-specific DNA-methyltransferase (cytosine-N4-specific)|nr:hypothetical protein [Methanolobus sp.]